MTGKNQLHMFYFRMLQRDTMVQFLRTDRLGAENLSVCRAYKIQLPRGVLYPGKIIIYCKHKQIFIFSYCTYAILLLIRYVY